MNPSELQRLAEIRHSEVAGTVESAEQRLDVAEAIETRDMPSLSAMIAELVEHDYLKLANAPMLDVRTVAKLYKSLQRNLAAPSAGVKSAPAIPDLTDEQEEELIAYAEQALSSKPLDLPPNISRDDLRRSLRRLALTKYIDHPSVLIFVATIVHAYGEDVFK